MEEKRSMASLRKKLMTFMEQHMIREKARIGRERFGGTA
jgi:hypothetical protein